MWCNISKLKQIFLIVMRYPSYDPLWPPAPPLCGHQEAQIAGYDNKVFTCYNITLLPLSVNIQSFSSLNMKFLQAFGYKFCIKSQTLDTAIFFNQSVDCELREIN